MTEDTRPFCLICRPPHRLTMHVDAFLYTCAKGHTFTQLQLMERAVTRRAAVEETVIVGANVPRCTRCSSLTTMNLWAVGAMEYIYGCWWKCRRCQRWVEHTPRP